MYDDFDDDDYRNARRRPRRFRPSYGPMGPGRMVGVPMPAAAVPLAPAVPWAQQAPQPPPQMSPLIDRTTGRFKLGFMLDAAAQALAALSSLPGAPPVQGESRVDMTNLLKYQEQLALHAKRDEQIRTLGALARLFLV